MVLYFVIDIAHCLIPPVRIFQVPFQPSQSRAQYIAVMQLRTERALAQTQPETMQPIQILRPKPRRMRSHMSVGGARVTTAARWSCRPSSARLL